MVEATALKKFFCPSCGAEAHWHPAKQALVCPYCGTVAPGSLEGSAGDIKENDLSTALRNLPDSRRGWQAEKISVKCQSCQAISVFDASRVGQRCDFCGSSALVPYEQIKPPIRPESLLAFKISEAQVREAIRGWYGKHWFAPNRLKNAALTDTVKGVYLPYWTFDAQAQAEWTAQSGYYYYTTESSRDANGQTQTRQVRHTRWENSSGSVNHFFDDELVAASKGVAEELLRKVEPFPTGEVTPYHSRFLAGWVVEQYQIDLIAAAQRSHERMEAEIYSLCAREVPGDTHQNLRVSTRFTQQTFKHVLLPVWLLNFHYGPKSFQVVVNGYTGTIAGKYPISAWKVTITVVAALIALLILYLITSAS